MDSTGRLSVLDRKAVRIRQRHVSNRRGHGLTQAHVQISLFVVRVDDDLAILPPRTLLVLCLDFMDGVASVPIISIRAGIRVQNFTTHHRPLLKTTLAPWPVVRFLRSGYIVATPPGTLLDNPLILPEQSLVSIFWGNIIHQVTASAPFFDLFLGSVPITQRFPLPWPFPENYIIVATLSSWILMYLNISSPFAKFLAMYYFWFLFISLQWFEVRVWTCTTSEREKYTKFGHLWFILVFIFTAVSVVYIAYMFSFFLHTFLPCRRKHQWQKQTLFRIQALSLDTKLKRNIKLVFLWFLESLVSMEHMWRTPELTGALTC